MLIAAEVDRLRGPQDAQCLVPARLRPAVAVQVGEQPVVAIAVQVHRTAERRLREGTLGPHPGPLAGPAGAPGELPLAQQVEPRQVDRGPVVGRINDVVGPRSQFRNPAEGTRLELAILENGEVDATDEEPGEVRPRSPASPVQDRPDRAGARSAAAAPCSRRQAAGSSRRPSRRDARPSDRRRPRGSDGPRRGRRGSRRRAGHGARRRTAARTLASRRCARCADRSGRRRRTAGPDQPPAGRRRVPAAPPASGKELHESTATVIRSRPAGSARTSPSNAARSPCRTR